jgi:hypothetical protein
MIEKIDFDEVAKIKNAVIKDSHMCANLFPYMTDDEFSGLVLSIMNNGFSKQSPIRRVEGKIWDGRNREVAVRYINAVEDKKSKVEGRAPKHVVAKYEDKTKEQLSEADIIKNVVQDNFHRRNISVAQRAAFVVRTGVISKSLANRTKISPEEKQKSEEVTLGAMQQAAIQSKLNVQYLYQCQRLLTEGRVDLLDRILLGEITIQNAIEVLNASAKPDGTARTRQVGSGRPRKDKPAQKADKETAEATAEEGKEGASQAEATKAAPVEEDSGAEKIYDQLKNEVPRELADVFAILASVDSLVMDIRKVREKFKGMSLAPGGKVFAEVDKESFDHLKKFVATLRANSPHSPCPSCDGTGKEVKGKKKVSCSTCNAKGWLTVHGYKIYMQFGQAADTTAKAEEKSE